MFITQKCKMVVGKAYWDKSSEPEKGVGVSHSRMDPTHPGTCLTAVLVPVLHTSDAPHKACEAKLVSSLFKTIWL